MPPGHTPEKVFNDVRYSALPKVDETNNKSFHRIQESLGTKVGDFVTSSIFNKLNVDLSNTFSEGWFNINSLDTNLVYLDLSNQNLGELPDNLISLNKLDTLLINNNKLVKLPDAIGNLINLKSLNASHNQLNEIPESLADLKNLEILNLNHNNLSNLPASFKKLNCLKTLLITNNAIKVLPDCIINGMNTLEVMDLSQNLEIKMNLIPYTRCLRKFIASGNKNCKKFPDWLMSSKFSNLQEINLDRTEFDVFCFANMRDELQIKTLSMAQSNISDDVLEKMTSKMVALQKLDVGNRNLREPGNTFWIQPFQDCNIASTLVDLNLKGTCLSLIPPTVKFFKKLVNLDLSSNSLTWLPEEISELDQLEVLNINGNGMILLPKMMGHMKALCEIRAGENCLSSLPDTMSKLKNLRVLDLYDNQFEEVPMEIEELENLEALNLEKNYFSTETIKIGNKSYDTYRNNIWNWKGDSSWNQKKQNGAKSYYKKKSTSSYSNYWKRSQCSAEALSRHGSNKSSTNSNPQTYGNRDNTIVTEENWDISDDSADEFEPTGLAVSKSSFTRVPFVTLPDFQNNFCPADIHSRSVKAEVKLMQTHGSLQFSKAEDGQFEDA